MQPSTRQDTLRAPGRAWKVPVLAISLVLLLVVGMIVVGKLGGWLVAFLVPVALFSLAIAVNVVVRLVKGPLVHVDDEEE